MWKIGSLCWLPALFLGCGEPSAPSTQADTRVHLYLTDFPIGDADVTRVLVTFTHIDVYADATQSWITVVDYGSAGRQFDLLTLQGGITDELGAFDLAPGAYDQIRLHLTPDHTIEVNDGSGVHQLLLKIPSGDETGIKIVGRFTVSGDGPTLLTLDFDASRSIHYTRGQGYMLKPTIKLVEVVTSEFAAKQIHAAQGGQVHLLGKAELRIPPGALAADTTIEIRKLEADASYTRKTGLLPGSIIQLEPSGLVFQVPAQLSLFYDPREIPPGLAPQDLTLVSHNRDEAWQEHPSVVSTSPFTATAAVSHFSDWAMATQESLICPPGSTLLFGSCTPVKILTFRCQPTVDVTAEIYDAANRPILLRELVWNSNDSSIAEAVPRSVDCAALSADLVACDRQPGCGSDLFSPTPCIADPRFKTIRRPGCGDTDIVLSVNGGNPLVTASLPVHTPDPFRFRLDSIDIHDDGDTLGAGEIYWRFDIDGVVSDHPIDRSASDGDTIPVGDSVDREVCGRSFHVSGFLADEDGGATGPDDVTGFDFGLRGPGVDEGGTGGSPDGTFHWNIQACP
jgi:Domain of unknown function (DUF4382)